MGELLKVEIRLCEHRSFKNQPEGVSTSFPSVFPKALQPAISALILPDCWWDNHHKNSACSQRELAFQQPVSASKQPPVLTRLAFKQLESKADFDSKFSIRLFSELSSRESLSV